MPVTRGCGPRPEGPAAAASGTQHNGQGAERGRTNYQASPSFGNGKSHKCDLCPRYPLTRFLVLVAQKDAGAGAHDGGGRLRPLIGRALGDDIDP